MCYITLSERSLGFSAVVGLETMLACCLKEMAFVYPWLANMGDMAGYVIYLQGVLLVLPLVVEAKLVLRLAVRLLVVSEPDPDVI